ncbi:trifunctional serine/threonine-protein kinase/ATP-binding protein/sensor histidine kinase [Desulfofustis glycolicus]|uniref:histidine kinase n=1 Tax=Desulfofustis glycolicus DSM 9705 TaxID=1121409 RepID=A0A1M5WKZ6_9BACT|nr:ATP-binding protein [Desulfofustis glycolicus]MCB2217136.1 AAA family ATPase [Desulfobulbaceae bacterium]SHH88147.1 Predicted ATPase [Desulfofustis glycolicus DSM 9705]
MNICGYTISECISESARSSIYRGIADDTGQRVILKVPAGKNSAATSANTIKHEFTILSRFRHNKIISAIGLGQHGPLPVLIEEDFNGLPLSVSNREGPVDFIRFLDIAIQLADALRDIHRHNIIYKNLCPAHILFRSITGRIKLVDFSIASTRNKEYPFYSTDSTFRGTLAYISPEQTGRINKELDYRSDFYSLGVVLYELLTGSRPFIGTDLIALVHGHLAKTPAPPQDFNPDIPDALANIVLKLIEKSADDRYQSCSGLIPDLMRCLIELRENRSIIDFGVGGTDISPVFSIPDRHFGRNHELSTVICGYDRIGSEVPRAYLITGASGSGKTSLLLEIQKVLEYRGAIVLRATAEHGRGDTPGAPIIFACRRLLRHLLSLDPEQRASWLDLLLPAFDGQQEQAVAQLPELRELFGTTPAASPDTALAISSNLSIAKTLLAAIDRHFKTLVVIQDDLHLVDPETLSVITSFLADRQRQGLLICSSADPDATAIFADTIDEPAGSVSFPVHLELLPLTDDEIAGLLSETLYQPLTDMLGLAHCCREKTGGNPFFLKQFLAQLHESGALAFNSKSGRWDYDLPAVMATDVTPNVGELLTRRIAAFPAGQRTVLQYAACIGPRFDLRLLSLVYGNTPQQTLADLAKALNDGLILPAAPQALGPSGTNEGNTQKTDYFRFAHEQIRHAAIALLPLATRNALGVRIGSMMQYLSESANHHYPLSDIVGHLNQGISALETDKQRFELATLNLEAAIQAKTSGTTSLYRRLSATALELLPASAWTTQYGLTLDVYSEAAEAAARSDLTEESERLFAIVCSRARTAVDSTRVYRTAMQLYRRSDRCREALRTGRTILAALGISLAESPGKHAAAAAFLSARISLFGRSEQALLTMPQMTDPIQASIMEVLLETALAAYQIRPALLPIISLTSIRLSLAHGHHRVASIIGYPIFGALLCSAGTRQYRLGSRYGQLALDLQKRSGIPAHPFSVHLVSTDITHWHRHLRHSQDSLQQACRQQYYHSESESAALCAVGCFATMFFLGRSLTGVLEETAPYRRHIDTASSGVRYRQMMLEQTIANLRGRTSDPSIFSGLHYDGIRMSSLLQHGDDRTTLFFFHQLGQLLAYLFGNYERAEQHGSKALALIDGVRSSFLLPIFLFIHTLTLLAICRDPHHTGRRSRWTAINTGIQKMRRWGETSPKNYRHRYHLLCAERHRITDQREAAAHHYEQAISLARQNGYQQDAALGYELAAAFYLASGRPLVARSYLGEALHHYRQWEAEALVDHLRKHSADLLVERRTGTREQAGVPVSLTTGLDASPLDLGSFVKASRAFSSEFVLDEVVRKLIMIVVENAGAEVGLLIMNPTDAPLVKVTATSGERQGAVVDTPLLAHRQRLSLAVIKHVTTSGETIVLDHACLSGPFTGDLYIRSNNTKSLLCVPIKHHGDLLAILYLENNLTTAAFSPERLDIIELIAGQAAISIKNAQLYEELQTTLGNLHLEVAKRKETQMQLLHAGKLAALSRLSASIAHEFGNPLIGIKYLLDDLSQRTELGRQDRDLIDVGLQECDRLKQLINDLHELHRPSSGKKILFNLNNTVENVLHLQRKNLKDAGITVATRLAEDLPDIRAVEDQISQVVVNLTTNAIDAMKHSEEKRLRVETAVRHQQVVLALTDSGSGITDEHREHIFEPFFSTKPYTDGTGLGLAIAYSIMKNHRGDISFSSPPDGGCTFTLSFPLSDAPDNPPQADHHRPAQLPATLLP